MQTDTDFAFVYKALVDKHMTPDPQLLEAMRTLLLHQLSARDPPGGKKSQ